jgi:hypothetical protein
MPSSDALHPHQLAMFLPAGKLRSMAPSDSFPGGSYEDVWEAKLREDKYKVRVVNETEDVLERIGPSIRKRGVLRPVEVVTSGGPRIVEGHHRVAIAADHNPEMEVPVKYR